MNWRGVMLIMATACNVSGALPAPERDLVETGTVARAVFAGGCFWCVEAAFEQVPGVTDVISGYTGGDPQTATYAQVCTGTTGHAEAVQVTYNPQKVSYGTLLRVFFTVHDPTTKNRQGPDTGPQYRSAIFFERDEQRDVAAAYIAQLEKAKVYGRPIVTTLEPLTGFFPAEEYHQDFAQRHPRHPYIRMWVPGKLERLRQVVPSP